MKRSAKNLAKYKRIVMEIWNERGSYCQKCNRPIGAWDSEEGRNMPLYHNISHGDRGRRSEKDCLDKTNITLLCFDCHAIEHGITTKGAQWLR